MADLHWPSDPADRLNALIESTLRAKLTPEKHAATGRLLMARAEALRLRRERRLRWFRLAAWSGGGLSLATAAAVALFMLLRPEAPTDLVSGAEQNWETTRLPGLGLFETRRPDSEWASGDHQIRLIRGTLRAQVSPQSFASPLIVVTPQLRVTVLGTRFDLAVTEGLSRILLIEGNVRVDSDSGSVSLSAGEMIDSNDPRLRAIVAPSAEPLVVSQPQRLAPVSPPSSSASLPIRNSPKRREQSEPPDRPLSRAALPSGGTVERVTSAIATENALFNQGMQQRGTPEGNRLFRKLLDDFPEGMFAGEATIQLMDEFRKEGKSEQALTLARGFVARNPHDPRAERVTRMEAAILCGGKADSLELKQVVQRLRTSGSAEANQEIVRLAESGCIEH